MCNYIVHWKYFGFNGKGEILTIIGQVIMEAESKEELEKTINSFNDSFIINKILLELP